MNSLSKDKAIQKHWKRSNWAYLSAKMTKESLENTVKLGNKCRHICMKLKAVIGPGEQKPQRQVMRNTLRVEVTIEAKIVTEEQGQSRKRE